MILPTRTLYTVFEVKFRRDCEYVEPDLSKNRYIGDFLANRQVPTRKIVQNALFLRFLCFFLARACVCAKKSVPLHRILKEGESVHPRSAADLRIT